MSASLTLQHLPLFPLGTTLFPGGLLPLRIFEVRYLDMIGKCHRHGAPFGVVTLSAGEEVLRPDSEGEAFYPVGTLARIEALDSPQPGLMLARCLGLQRFRILRQERLRHGLWTADVARIEPDAAVRLPDELHSTTQALQRLMQTLSLHPPANWPGFAPPHQFDDAGWVANRWCELLPLPHAAKQRLLALDSPLLRLELVSDLLEQHGIRAD